MSCFGSFHGLTQPALMPQTNDLIFVRGVKRPDNEVCHGVAHYGGDPTTALIVCFNRSLSHAILFPERLP